MSQSNQIKTLGKFAKDKNQFYFKISIIIFK